MVIFDISDDDGDDAGSAPSRDAAARFDVDFVIDGDIHNYNGADDAAASTADICLPWC